ncbi:hypothetical protein [Solitalea canadensis]|uniref:Transcriptional regulator n=1 Tax=Solitalea canadensis (strain ATCC 29591 / DSM 3403 / JCM 21819 / LMG 8368 / NBRC 15130 / NCIMB 12057 / USAM 9D) TaxID=929556 RepID=H8KNV1_SOLCM|nr:hypothetical protein [Solitalea canadensis]AFD05362.1 hypothetical protein Solca_0216 [Solitalea canadensis DSM 3403]
MATLKELSEFFDAIQGDPKISVTHVSLFMAILKCYHNQGYKSPVTVFSYELMPIAKISSSATFHKTLRELAEYRYIRYEPSFNNRRKSRIFLNE